jgi:3-oxoacyl-[acyl-carrier protein] reductase
MPLPVAVVTGASRGIGRAIALELVKTHHVIATYRGNREAAESLVSEAGADAVIEAVQSDVSSAEDRAALVASLRERFSHLDLLINNAGVAPRERRDVLEATEESLDELIAINLKGPHFLTQAVANWMLESKAGRIVYITSVSAFAVSTPRVDYCMSKAALSMSAQGFAARLAPEGIGVFEIQPGVIRTDMIAKVEQVYEERIANGLVPQRRMGEGRDIAKAVRAIADGLLDYSAGQVLNVDGGFHLRTL